MWKKNTVYLYMLCMWICMPTCLMCFYAYTKLNYNTVFVEVKNVDQNQYKDW